MSHTPTPPRAFTDGFNARTRLEMRSSCPYSEDASEEEVRDAWTAWQDGWDKADQRSTTPPRYSSAPDSVTEALIRASARV